MVAPMETVRIEHPVGIPTTASTPTPTPTAMPGPIAHATPTELEIGDRSREEWIALDRLTVVNRTYQRPYDEAWAKTIAKRFDSRRFTKPEVAPLDNGFYAIIDGQHRIGALQLLYPERPIVVLCDVVEAATIEEQAEAFAAHNIFVKHVKAADRFRNELARGEETAVRIDALVRAHGFALQLNHNPQTDGKLRAVQSLRRVATKHREGFATLDLALRVIHEAWGGSTDGVGVVLIEGLGSFLARYAQMKQFSVPRLIESLRRISARKIEADSGSVATVFGGNTAQAAARIILGEYNKRLAQHNRLPETTDARATQAQTAA
jgi:hypothetical protein